MTTQTETSGGAEPCVADTHPEYWRNLTAEDIPPGWIDNMVKRLFNELNRQMIRAEKIAEKTPEKKDHNGNLVDDPEAREQNARTLARLEASLTRLTKMEMERAALRTTKAARTRTESRSAIRRKLLAKSHAGRTGRGAGDAQ